MARPPRRPSAPGSAPRRPEPETTAAPVKPGGRKTAPPAAGGAARGASAGAKRSGSSSRPGSRPGTPRAGGSRPARPKQPPAPPSSAWVAGVRGSGFTLLIMGILILAVVVLAPSIKTFVEQRAEIAELQRTVDEAKTQSQNLDEQRTRWSDPAFIRAQARERLYFVMPGEVSYLVLDDIAVAQQAEQPASDSVQQTPTDWAGALLSSIAVAGLGEPTVDELAPAEEPAPAPAATPAP